MASLYDKAVEGLDFSRPVSAEDVAFTPQGDARLLGAIKSAQDQSKVTAGEQLRNIGVELPTYYVGQSISNAIQKEAPDPSFTHERYLQRVKLAREAGLPEAYLENLGGIASDAEFDRKLSQAQRHAQAADQLEKGGWGTWAANMGAGMLDPVTNAAWFGGGALFSRAAMLAGMGNRSAHMVGGGLGGLSAGAAQDAAGKPTDASEYLQMAGMGLAWNAFFGPMSKNPAVAEERAVLGKVGQELQRTTPTAVTDAPTIPSGTLSGVKRAEQSAETAQFRAARKSAEEALGIEGTDPANRPQVSTAKTAEGVRPEPAVEPTTIRQGPEGSASAVPAEPLPEGMPETAPSASSQDIPRPADEGTDPVKAARKAKYEELFRLIEADRQSYEGRSFQDFLKDLKRAELNSPLGPRSDTEIPLLHGTPRVFDKLDAAQAKGGRREFYFTDDQFMADAFAKRYEKTQEGIAPNVHKVFVETKGFKTVDLQGLKWGHLKKEVAKAKAEGYPGLIAENVHDVSGVRPQYITWTKGTVRSAYSDNVMFSKWKEADAAYPRSSAQHVQDAVDNYLKDEIAPIVARLPKGTQVTTSDLFQAGEQAKYSHGQGAIALNRAAFDPKAALTHEETHVLRQNGLFKANEWDILVDKAKSLGIREKYGIDELYGKDIQKLDPAVYGEMTPQRVEELLWEESVARMREMRVAGQNFGATVNGLLDRIKEFLDRLRNYWNGRGFKSAEDIERAIHSGEIGGRGEVTPGEFKGYQAARNREPRSGELDTPNADLKGKTWTADGLKFLKQDDNAEGKSYFVYPEKEVAKGAPIAHAVLEHNGKGWEVSMVEVDPFHRGKKIAYRLYNQIEKDLGIEMQPSGTLRPDGYQMWMKRDAEAVQHHRQIGAMYYSPKQLFERAAWLKDQAAGKPGTAFERQLRSTLDVLDTLPPEAKTPQYLDSIYSRMNQNPVVKHDFLQDSDLKAVQDEDAPKSWTFWSDKNRIDNSGKMVMSDNALERLIGRSVLNDTVGTVDHSVNAFSADLDYRRMYAQRLVEWNRVAKPAYEAWAKDKGFNMYQRQINRGRFNEEVGDCIRDTNKKPGDYHQAVEQAAAKAAQIQADILEDLKNPLRREGLVGNPVKGADWVQEDANYLWRLFDQGKVNAAIEKFGETGVVKMVDTAIKNVQPDLDDMIRYKIAAGYVKNIRSRAAGLGDEWSLAMAHGDKATLTRILRDECHLSDTELANAMERIRGSSQPAEGDMANLKRRVFLDETHKQENLSTVDGGVDTLAFKDLLVRNADTLMTQYFRKTSGRVALARVRLRLKDGTMIQDGITSDAEMTKLLEGVQKYGLDHGQTKEEAQASRDRLQFAFDRILGVPLDSQQTNYADVMRLTRRFMATRLMGQVGIAQIGEAGQAVGVLGLRAALSHMPGLQRIISAAGESRLTKDLFDELESMGIGSERLHGLYFHNADEAGLPFEVDAHGALEKLNNIAKFGENATYELSLMSIVQQQQERWVAAAMAQKIANMGETLRAGKSLATGDKRRLAQLGVGEPMLARILDQIGTHSDMATGAFFGQKLNRLNMGKWTDLEARAAFENSLYRMTRKLIQAGDEGSAATWMHGPTAQTIFQFRGFTFTAYANQTLYNLHMGDPAAAFSMAAGVVWNAAVRAAQVQLLALGRSDAEDWKAKQLSPWELSKAGVSRAGASSVFPMVADTGLLLLGQPGQFNARTSGQASDVIFGSPVSSFMSSLSKGMGGVAGSLYNGREMSQAEARAAVGALPFSNLLSSAVPLSFMINNLPEKAPKQQAWAP